eukprot:TRINITY_DN1197_c0_g1_i1.p1 TRINITY_DN1197_c0_g1~~TRINITY_DN1197_c0_g1_i1.p1  ORF type:complete len:236 (+),score=61.51 TRINITY_DN1197_c0_g1_i1:61-708(+)
MLGLRTAANVGARLAARTSAPRFAAAPTAVRASPALALRQQGLLRAFSASSTQQFPAAMMAPVPKPLPTAAPAAVQEAVAAKVPTAAAESAIDAVRSSGLVFEIGLTFTFTHYISIFQSFARCLFQAFRPLLILFVFGQLIKAAFFMMGAPLWFSFYSIWLFEVGYGLAQCAISFIFISFFYNNCSFARVRPSLIHHFRQHREQLARAARMIGIA